MCVCGVVVVVVCGTLPLEVATGRVHGTCGRTVKSPRRTSRRVSSSLFSREVVVSSLIGRRGREQRTPVPRTTESPGLTPTPTPESCPVYFPSLTPRPGYTNVRTLGPPEDTDNHTYATTPTVDVGHVTQGNSEGDREGRGEGSGTDRPKIPLRRVQGLHPLRSPFGTIHNTSVVYFPRRGPSGVSMDPRVFRKY